MKNLLIGNELNQKEMNSIFGGLGGSGLPPDEPTKPNPNQPPPPSA